MIYVETPTETDPTPNVPLIKDVMAWVNSEHAKGEKGRWNQADWIAPPLTAELDLSQPLNDFCGTSQCFAGHALAVEYGDRLTVVWLNDYHEWAPYVDNVMADWQRDGAKVLGLTDGEAYELFLNSSSIEQVRNTVAKILARAGEAL